MATRQYDRVVINVRERPLSSDHNQLQSNIHASLMDLYLRVFASRNALGDDGAVQFGAGGLQAGFIGDAFKVRAQGAPNMSVRLAPGLGFYSNAADLALGIGGLIGLDDAAQLHPLAITNPFNININAAPPGGSERYDIIEVTTDRRLESSLTRDILDVPSGAFVPGLVNKVLAFALDSRTQSVASPSNAVAPPSGFGIAYKSGATAAVGAGVVPTSSPGFFKIAEIYVGPAVASIAPNAIRDLRPIIWPYNMGRVSAIIQATAAATPTGVSVVRLVAPPGVLVTAVGVAGGKVRVYIVAGANPAIAIPDAAPVGQTGTATGAFIIDDLVMGPIVLGDQTPMGVATPPVAVAIGQPAMSFTFTPVTATPQLYSVSVDMGR